MGQSIDCQRHFGHQVGRRKASYANHAAQVGEKTAVCLLSDRLLEDLMRKLLVDSILVDNRCDLGFLEDWYPM